MTDAGSDTDSDASFHSATGLAASAQGGGDPVQPRNPDDAGTHSNDVSPEVSSDNPQAPKVTNSIHIYGNARVHMGDNHDHNKHIFDEPSPETKRARLLEFLTYDGFDLKREQLSLAELGPSAFSWIEGTTIPAWLCSGQDPFWIRGKPASGKSTLMRYLADSRRSLERLEQDGHRWGIVYYFFDYRAGRTFANKLLGMLKLFLRQLLFTFPSVRSILEENVIVERLANEDIDTYMDLLSSVVTKTNLKLCAFIDGLDEYDDDLWKLCSQLETLRTRTGMKLCLASRPDPAFEEWLSSYPTIVMQEHNRASIKAYTERNFIRCTSKYPCHSDIFTPELEDAVVEKAAGVILWAKLVVDEMIDKCDENTCLSDLMAFLEALPTELEGLYERILGKTDPKRHAEAALVLYLLVENEATLKAAVLFEAWNFVDTVVGTRITGTTDSVDLFKYRGQVGALLGNMVDFVGITLPTQTIRLVHKSLAAYLARSDWIQPRLSTPVTKKYPDRVWERLSSDVIIKMGDESAIDMVSLEERIQRNVGIAQTYASKFESNRHVFWRNFCTELANDGSLIRNLIASSWWISRLDLLEYCICNSFRHDKNDYQANEHRHGGLHWPQAGRYFCLIHYMKCSYCSQRRSPFELLRVLRMQRSNVLHLFVEFLHGCYQGVEGGLVVRLLNLGTTVAADFFDLTLFYRFPPSSFKQRWKVLQSFASHSHFVDNRHLCQIVDRDILGGRPWFEKTIIEAAGLRPKERPWSQQHDPDCIYYRSGIGLLRHYLDTNTVGNYGTLSLFIRSGLDPGAPVDVAGRGVLGTILDKACNDTNLETARLMFNEVVRIGGRPVPSTSCDLLSQAKTSLRRAKIQRFKDRLSRKDSVYVSIPYVEFLSDVITALENYKRDKDSLPQLPER